MNDRIEIPGYINRQEQQGKPSLRLLAGLREILAFLYELTKHDFFKSWKGFGPIDVFGQQFRITGFSKDFNRTLVERTIFEAEQYSKVLLAGESAIAMGSEAQEQCLEEQRAYLIKLNEILPLSDLELDDKYDEIDNFRKIYVKHMVLAIKYFLDTTMQVLAMYRTQLLKEEMAAIDEGDRLKFLLRKRIDLLQAEKTTSPPIYNELLDFLNLEIKYYKELGDSKPFVINPNLLSMNEFYDISEEDLKPNSDFQLRNLGAKVIFATLGGARADDHYGRGASSQHFYRDTEPKDYDREFLTHIKKTYPAYHIFNLLDHHFQVYNQRHPGEAKTFLRHMKYEILPELQKGTDFLSHSMVLSDWINEKEKLPLTPAPSVKAMPIVKEPENHTEILTHPDADQQDSEIFISYCWEKADEHDQKVLAFTNHLRKNGFNARLDKVISQEETATNFLKMMHKAMFTHKKIIVVLSKDYKTRAENFTGGVGEEYQILLGDIKRSPKKYILVSFNGRGDEIVPLGLRDREVIDLSLSSGMETLFRKLTDQDKYVLSPVAQTKPSLPPAVIDSFESLAPSSIISIEQPGIERYYESIEGGYYQELNFSITLKFKNVSGKPLNSFDYSLKFKRELMPGQEDLLLEDGFYTIFENVSKKFFPGTIVHIARFNMDINSHLVNHILGSVLTVTVFTEHGPNIKEFEVESLFQVARPGDPADLLQPLSKDMFG